MKYFWKLPLQFRLVIVLSFLAASIVVGILGRPSLVLSTTAIVLLLSGGWRISKARSFIFALILMPMLLGLLLTHFDWHHPFLSRYAAGLYSVIAVLLLMDGVHFEEWIEVFQRTPLSRLAALLIGTAVGTVSMSSNIREQRSCRKLANVRSWPGKSGASIFLDSVALPFYNAVESHNLIDEALQRWTIKDNGTTVYIESEAGVPSELSFGNSNFVAQLSDLHDFPGYREVAIAALGKIPITEAWIGMGSQLATPARILDIGDPTRRFAKYLLARGLEVIVANRYGRWPPHRPFCAKTIPQAMERPDQEALPHDCDHLFFHYLSFLEVINEDGVRDVLTRLHNGLHTGAHACFDYPTHSMPASKGVIFSGSISRLKQADLRYSEHELNGNTHGARLEYTFTQEAQVSYVRTPVSFIIPELSDVLDAARDLGFSCSLRSMPGALSFCPGEIMFVDLQRYD